MIFGFSLMLDGAGCASRSARGTGGFATLYQGNGKDVSTTRAKRPRDFSKCCAWIE